MLIGQTLAAPATGGGAIYYSPWFPRGGNAGVFQLDLMEVVDMSTVQFAIETKNTEDDDKDALTSFASVTISSFSSLPARTKLVAGASLDSTTTDSGFRELVRYRYTLDSSSSDGGFIHFRMLNPAWLSN